MPDNIYHTRIYKQTAGGYYPVALETPRGRISCRYYHAASEKRAVIYVGGTGGDFDTPARGLYPRLCKELLAHGINGLRVKYRNPVNLASSVYDVMVGIAFLKDAGVEEIGLVGHSFGGAVVIQAGARSALVKTVITLATQSAGTDKAASYRNKPLMLIHGASDHALRPQSSYYVYNIANEPKQIVVLEKASHVLNEKADDVHTLVYAWLMKYLLE